MSGHPLPFLLSVNWTAIADFAAPTVAVIVGLFIYFLTSRMDHKRWTSQKVIERRIQVFESMAPRINKLFCYFSWIGRWKEFTPGQIVDMKRELDDAYFTNEFLFSADLRAAYDTFIGVYFEHFTGPNQDGKLRTTVVKTPGKAKSEDRSKVCTCWEEPWEEQYFSKKKGPSTLKEIKRSYEQLMEAFRRDLELPRPKGSRQYRLPLLVQQKNEEQGNEQHSAKASAAEPITGGPVQPPFKDPDTLKDQAKLTVPSSTTPPS
jgi:hypothetical protein